MTNESADGSCCPGIGPIAPTSFVGEEEGT
jgi:hypothetical protein